MEDFMIQEELENDRNRRSERPRINIPLPSPEYLRYLEEQEEQEEKESNRGVTILQM